MKTLLIKATNQVRENVDNTEAARLVAAGEASEVKPGYQILGKPETAPAKKEKA